MAQHRPLSLWREFDIAKALFEIAIVAVGVLLALLVDQAREAGENRQLATESIAAMNVELQDNRWRYYRKLELLHLADHQLAADPAQAAQLVASRRNQQVTPSSAAWDMTLATGALRQMSPEDRGRYGMTYTAQRTYYDLLVREMELWSDLAAFDPADRSPETIRNRDRAINLWRTWANRVALGTCIVAARIELISRPELSRDRLWSACIGYRISQPPAALYKAFGVPRPPVRGFL